MVLQVHYVHGREGAAYRTPQSEMFVTEPKVIPGAKLVCGSVTIRSVFTKPCDVLSTAESTRRVQMIPTTRPAAACPIRFLILH